MTKTKIVNHERLALIITEIEGIVEREEMDLVEQKLLFDLLQGRFNSKIGQKKASDFTTGMLDKFGLGRILGK